MPLELTKHFVTVQKHFIAYCKCKEAAKLFRFLLSPYSLIGDLQQCAELHLSLTDRDGGCVNICFVVGGRGITNLLGTPGIVLCHENSSMFVFYYGFRYNTNLT
jgi:hypothetical protein